MPAIQITGATILIDEADLSIVAGRTIGLSHGYPRIKQGQSRVPLHRVIMGAQPGQLVDHANRNILDNRRKNLRLCTRRENGRNRKGPASHNTSGYRGVTRNRTWGAQIKIGGKNIHLGRFKTKEAAASAYDAAALRYFGEYAGKLNFPQD